MVATALALLLATTAQSHRGAVATAHPLASEAGALVLRKGGNAVDAAVAAAFALAVVEPSSSGLGGGGFALLYSAKEQRLRVLDFREVAPAKADSKMYLRDGQVRADLARDGPLAVAVPGAVKGYAELVERWGTRPLAHLTGPAEALAERGFTVTKKLALLSEKRHDCLAADPEARRLFTARDPDGEGDDARRPLRVGDRLVQKDLARTLHAIGQHGADAFYRGPIARRLARAVQVGGGLLTVEDLAAYRTREREPLLGSYRGWRIATMPAPSSGGPILLSLLGILEGQEPREGGYRPEAFLHAMIEAEKRLFAERERMGDPAHNPEMDALVRRLTSPEYAAQVRTSIGPQATPSPQLVVRRESNDTTHISVIDGAGNAVALTTTVNYLFGSCVVAPGTGVVLNDEMDDFAAAPGVANVFGVRGGSENAPGAGKIPLSSMTPTLAFDPEGRLRLAVGSPGGSTIPTTVLQVLLHVIDDKMPIDQAVAAPRFHHQLFPDSVRVEPNALEAATAAALRARGHMFQETEPWGNANAVWRDPATGLVEAASDPRYDGLPAAP